MKSIRGRLLTGILIVCALVLAGLAGLMEFSLRNGLIEQFDERLRVQALAITTVTKQEREYIDIAFTDRYLREFSADDPVRFYQFWSPLPFHRSEGETVLRSDSLDGLDLPRRVGTMQQPAFWNFQLADGRPARAIGIRYVPHADRYDRRRNYRDDLNLDLVVAEDRSHLEASLAAIRTNILLVGFGGLAALVLVVPIMLRQGLRPLNDLTRQAEQVTAANLGYRFPESGLPRELEPICAALNQSLERLQRSFEREQRFSADLAHELRTPIAELRSLAESHLAFPESDQPEEQEFANDAHNIALQMQTIVAKLLWIYRSEQARLPINPERIDVRELIEDLWQPHRETSCRKRIQFTTDIHDSTLSTDRTLITSIVGNLLENAAEYTPMKGEIHVQYRETAGQFSFSVSNTADDIAPSQCRRMFDRFWRGDKARSSGQHVGLGLSIVSSFAEMAGYQVKAACSGPSQLTISLEGPAHLTPAPAAV